MPNVTSKLIDGRPAERCASCHGTFSWARIADGVCSGCWAGITKPAAVGCDHEALKADAEAWAALPLVGVQESFLADEPALELRNCACGSTLAAEVPSSRRAA